MLNLDNAAHLLSRLPIRDIRTNDMVPFRFNPNQALLLQQMRKQYEEQRKLRVAILKSRRTGMSSEVDGFAFCHCLGNPNREAKIVAHLSKTADSLFRVPRDLARGVPWFPAEDVQGKRILFRHSEGDSLLHIATAGTPGAGRGDTLSFLHLSEAAKFPGSESFLSLLPSVSKGDHSVVITESTANGREGPGEPFASFWEQSVEGKNGYIPVFLSWLNDPDCIRDPDEAEDAPADDLERELMRPPFNASLAQVAWMRRTKADECRDLEQLWLQEFPHSPNVAFTATGDPAFPRDEQVYAEGTIKEPLATGMLRRTSDNKVEWIQDSRGMLHIWEFPFDENGVLRDDHYCVGADAALGTAEGDFAAYIVLNKSTGNIAARMADRIHPEMLADQLDLVGRWYKRAMVNIELTGNLGRWAQKLMRDVYRYPNLYEWKGKDDRKIGKHKSVALGFETTQATRRLLFDAFRGALREGMRGEAGGLILNDHAIVTQMSSATVKDWSWDVKRGHDDILFAAMLTVLTAKQYPAPRIRYGNKLLRPELADKQNLPPSVPDVAFELQRHWKEVMKASTHKGHGRTTMRGNI